MGSLNKVILIGNLGADPEQKFLPSGACVVNLSIATTDKWKDKQSGEQREQTEWHRISFFGRPAEVIAEFAKKGSSMYVEGSIQTRKWQDKEGNDRYSTEIKGQNFQFLGGGSGASSSPRTAAPAAASTASGEQPAAAAPGTNDIPF